MPLTDSSGRLDLTLRTINYLLLLTNNKILNISKHGKICESCKPQVIWKVKFKCQFVRSRPVSRPVLSCPVLSCPVLSMTTMFTMFTMTTMINMTNMTIMTTMTTMTTMTMATSWRLSDQMRAHSHVDYSLQRLCGPSHM